MKLNAGAAITEAMQADRLMDLRRSFWPTLNYMFDHGIEQPSGFAHPIRRGWEVQS